MRAPGQADRALAGEEYYVPGSILRVAVDNTAPVASGHAGAARRVLRQQPGVPPQAGRGAQGHEGGRVVRQRDAAAQRLGVGPELSRGRRGRSSRRAYGKGKVYLFGPEITFRGQPHGTFKFLFNGIYAPTQPQGIVP